MEGAREVVSVGLLLVVFLAGALAYALLDIEAGASVALVVLAIFVASRIPPVLSPRRVRRH